MLWKKQLSVYTQRNGESKKEGLKTRTTLAPLLTSTPHPLISQSSAISKTLETHSPLPKFAVRKQQSKSTRILKQQIPHSFYLHKGNNHPLIKQILETFGYSQTLSKQQSNLIWYQGRDIAKKDLLTRKDISNKIINYFPYHSELTNKQNLYENLVKYEKSCVGDFLPKTFIVDFKDSLEKVEQQLSNFVLQFLRKGSMPKRKSLVITNYYGQICIMFSKLLRQLKQQKIDNKQTDTLWIVKPSFMNRGKGIEVISTLKQLQKIMSEDNHQICIKMYQNQQHLSSSCYIIQEYIMNPLLYQGYKFDIRVWMLLRKSKKDGLEVYVYRKGYARLAGRKYSLFEEGGEQIKKNGSLSPQKDKVNKNKKSIINDPFMHLTNNAIQKNAKNYGEIHEGNQITLQHLIQYISEQDNKSTLTLQTLFDQFNRIIKIMIESTKDKLISRASYGTFQLMGLDFMIDDAYKIWLIQANCNPCLEQSSTLLKNVLPKMLRQMLNVVKIQKYMRPKTSKTQKNAQNQSKMGKNCDQTEEQGQLFWERII